MKLVKQQKFNVDDRNGCASIYEYLPTKSITPHHFYAVCIYLEGRVSFVNRSIKTRADAEKIYNQQLDKVKLGS